MSEEFNLSEDVLFALLQKVSGNAYKRGTIIKTKKFKSEECDESGVPYPSYDIRPLKEFNLSEKRKELLNSFKDREISVWNTVNFVLNEIEKQDKELIRIILKDIDNPSHKINCSFRVIEDIIKKRAGDLK